MSVRNGKGADVRDAKFVEILCCTVYIYLTLHCPFEVLSVRNGKGADVRDAKFVEILYCIFNPALPIWGVVCPEREGSGCARCQICGDPPVSQNQNPLRTGQLPRYFFAHIKIFLSKNMEKIEDHGHCAFCCSWNWLQSPTPWSFYLYQREKKD